MSPRLQSKPKGLLALAAAAVAAATAADGVEAAVGAGDTVGGNGVVVHLEEETYDEKSNQTKQKSRVIDGRPPSLHCPLVAASVTAN